MRIELVERLKAMLLPYKQYLEIYLSRIDPKSIANINRQKGFYSRFIRPGDLVFDVGAHIGNKTEVFASLDARVVSVEPQERCIKIMKRRFRNRKNVTLVHKGISDKEGALDLLICDRANTVSTFSDKWRQGRFKELKWTRSIQVPVTTLDGLMGKYGCPVFCKIDVEGHELNVLKGLSHPIKYICFEFTKEFLDDAMSCIDRLETLGSAGFNCFAVGRGFLFKDWVDPQMVREKLTQINDELLHGDIYSYMK